MRTHLPFFPLSLRLLGVPAGKNFRLSNTMTKDVCKVGRRCMKNRGPLVTSGTVDASDCSPFLLFLRVQNAAKPYRRTRAHRERIISSSSLCRRHPPPPPPVLWKPNGKRTVKCVFMIMMIITLWNIFVALVRASTPARAQGLGW